MKVSFLKQENTLLTGDSGIAIGPILFIIAVLGILAAAIAAGSGSFNSNTTTESDRTKAAAIMEIGQSLKMGFERMTVGTELAFEDVLIGPNTPLPTELFSPVGGGLPAPSVTMALDPSADAWHYPLLYDNGLGTLHANCPAGAVCGNRYAVLRVSAGVCDEINKKANAIAITATPGASAGAQDKDMGDFTLAANETAPVNDEATWTMPGKLTGCIYNNNATAASQGWFFFQVLGIR